MKPVELVVYYKKSKTNDVESKHQYRLIELTTYYLHACLASTIFMGFNSPKRNVFNDRVKSLLIGENRSPELKMDIPCCNLLTSYSVRNIH